MFLSSQRKINQAILNAFDGAQFMFYASYLSVFDSAIEDRIYERLSKGIPIYIQLNLGPFMTHPTFRKHIDRNKGFHYKTDIHECSECPVNFSSLMYNHTQPFKPNIDHMRYLATDRVLILGGVDYNRNLECPLYKQSAILIYHNDSDNIYQYFKALFETPNRIPRVGVSKLTENFIFTNRDSDSYETLTQLIGDAKRSILVESQYLNSATYSTRNKIIKMLLEKCRQNPNFRVLIITNSDFTLNPYHPFIRNVFGRFSAMYMKYLTMWNLHEFRDYPNQVQFYAYDGGYTHNKIWVFDSKTMFITTANIDDRSFGHGDYELGIMIRDPKPIRKYLHHLLRCRFIELH